MFEEQNFETILKRMLATISAGIDKREGSVIYDATAPAAIEFELLYYQLGWYLKQSFADTADREYLIRLALERGLRPETATYSTVKGQFTPATLEVALGARFSLGTVNFIVIEKVSPGLYLFQCETAGTIGNNIAGDLIPINYINGLESAALLEVVIPGEDEEETEVFRQRYLTSFNSNAYGGNIADYKEKVAKLEGVGGVKVYPIWEGGGTVKVVFCTSEFKPPTSEFVDLVQTTLDPVINQGIGVGVAPIGHLVTVAGADDSEIAIGLNITYSPGYSFTDLRDQIEAVLDGYFLELNKAWQDTQVVSLSQYSNNGLVVKVSQIESRLLEIEQITDIQDTTLNGVTGNLILGLDALAVRGEVSG